MVQVNRLRLNEALWSLAFLCVVLASVISAAAYFIMPWHRHNQAVEHIRKLGGSIEHGSTDYNTYADVILRDIPLTRDDLEIIVYFERMAALDLNGTGISREDYRWLLDRLRSCFTTVVV